MSNRVSHVLTTYSARPLFHSWRDEQVHGASQGGEANSQILEGYNAL